MDEGTLFREFVAEILGVVGSPLAEKLSGVLAHPWASLQSAGTPENRAKVLSVLDLVEDLLDALVLLGPARVAGPEMPEVAP